LDDVLAEFKRKGIPSVIIGGYAVQEHGYYRTTDDIDVVVPDVAAARAALVSGGKFKPNQGSSMTVTHRDTKFEVDILKGGALVDRHSKVPLPRPTSVGRDVVPLPTLIALKLDSYVTHPIVRAKDLGDVVELIQANDLPRDFIPEPAYAKLWDDLRRDLKKRLLR
jgi:hypothetical protein